jgi:hypothetical protein
MAGSLVEVFDFKNTSVVVNGKYLTGFMDGTAIQTEKNEDNKTPHVGADGQVTFSNSADNTGTITVTLKQTSPSLKYLIALSKYKSTLFPVKVIDHNNNKIRVGGNKCVILKTPAIEWGSEVAGVEVQFYVADYDVTYS